MSAGKTPDVRELLSELRDEPRKDDFARVLHERLVAAGPPAPEGAWSRLRALFVERRTPLVALGAAACTAAVLFAVLPGAEPAPMAVVREEIAQPPTEEKAPDLAVHRMGADKVAFVRVNIESDVRVEDANFSVTLPEGLAFYSDGEVLPERQFSWTAPLEAGDNPLPIAVKGETPGSYELVASVEVEGEVFEHRVTIEVEEQG